MRISYLTVLSFASTVVGQVTFHNGFNINKCMDLLNYDTTTGNVIILCEVFVDHIKSHAECDDSFDCDGDWNQQWFPDYNEPAIHLYADWSLCFDGGSNPQVGSPVMIAPCNPNFSSQRFIPTLNNLIELSATGLCIGVPGDANYNVLTLENCDSFDFGQVWRIAQLKLDG